MLGLNGRTLGLDIGSGNIKWIVFGGNCIRPVIYNWGMIKTPPGSLRDGRIVDPNGLRKSMDEVLDNSGMKISRASITLSCPEMIIRTLDLPRMQPVEMDGAVRYEAEQYIPVNAEEYIIDYRVIDEQERDGARLTRVLMAAIPSGIVQGYVQLLESLNIKPGVVDFHGNSAARFLSRCHTLNGDGGCVILDIGASSATVSISENGIPLFTRVIQCGGREIYPTAADTFSVSIEDDVYRSIEFYRTKTHSRVSLVTLIGGGSYPEGLSDYFCSRLNLEYGKIDGALPLSFEKTFDSDQLLFYANVLGLAYRRDR